MTTQFRKLAFAAILSVTAMGTLTMTSCKKDDVTCDAGYEGTDCKTEVRTKFIKTWNAEDTPPSATKLLYTCPIATGTTISAVVISKSFGDSYFDNNLNATTSGTKITIPSQEPDGDGYKVEGSGDLINGKISWNYTITPPTGAGTPVSVTGIWN